MTNSIIEPLLNNFPYEDNDYYMSLDDNVELNSELNIELNSVKKNKKRSFRKILKKKTNNEI